MSKVSAPVDVLGFPGPAADSKWTTSIAPKTCSVCMCTCRACDDAHCSEQVLCWHLEFSTNSVISPSDQNWCPVSIRASGQVQPAAEVSLGLGKGFNSAAVGAQLGLGPSETPAGQRCLLGAGGCRLRRSWVGGVQHRSHQASCACP